MIAFVSNTPAESSVRPIMKVRIVGVKSPAIGVTGFP